MKTIKGTIIELGTCVVFDKYYNRNCSNRFNIDSFGYAKEATPIKLNHWRHGYVVGTRSVIMSEATYNIGRTLETEEGVKYIKPSFKGKRETVLLVTKNIREEPFIVRLCDCQ